MHQAPTSRRWAAAQAAAAARAAVGSGGAKGGSEVAPSEMERLTTVKAKIAAGRYTGWKRGREKSVYGYGCVWACEKVCFERDSENEIE